MKAERRFDALSAGEWAAVYGPIWVLPGANVEVP